MTQDEGQRTLASARQHVGSERRFRLVPYDCPGGWAVVLPVSDWPGLYYILTEFGPNMFEWLEVMANTIPIVRLDPATGGQTDDEGIRSQTRQ